MSSRSHARWWRLVALVPSTLLLFAIEQSITAASQWHTLMQSAIVLLVFGLMAFWLRSNEGELSSQAASRLHLYDFLEFPAEPDRAGFDPTALPLPGLPDARARELASTRSRAKLN